MINDEGEGPTVETIVEKDLAYKSTMNLDLNSLIVAGEYSIIMKSLDPLIETKTLFKSEELLSDVEINQHNRQVFVVDGKGLIYRLDETFCRLSVPGIPINSLLFSLSFYLDNHLNYSMVNIIFPVSDFIPRKVSVDWLNQMLYIAGEVSLAVNMYINSLIIPNFSYRIPPSFGTLSPVIFKVP